MNTSLGTSGGGVVTIIKADGRRIAIPFTNTVQTAFKASLVRAILNGGSNTGIHPKEMTVSVVNAASGQGADIYTKSADMDASGVTVSQTGSGNNYSLRFESSFGSASDVWDSTSGSGSSKSFTVGGSGTSGLAIKAHNNDPIFLVTDPIGSTQIDNNDTVNIDYTFTLTRPTVFTVAAMTAIRVAIQAVYGTTVANGIKFNTINWLKSDSSSYGGTINLVGIYDTSGTHGSSSGQWVPQSSISTATSYRSVGGASEFFTDPSLSSSVDPPASFEFRNSTNAFVQHTGLTFSSPDWTDGDRMKVDYTLEIT